MTDVAAEAARRYDELGIGELPAALRRNNLEYYYLSVWPGLAALDPAESIELPPYPDTISSAYFHLPFCSGVCSFCSYYVVVPPSGDLTMMASYVDSLLRHVDLVGADSNLELTYVYFGGGTPSLLPPHLLDRLLSGLRSRGRLAPGSIGTLEAHPELFADASLAGEVLAVLADHDIKRISLGLQFDDDDLLAQTNRRHGGDVYDTAMAQLSAAGFMTNLDAMYGCPGESTDSWIATLNRAVELAPDSISAYCTFIDPGTSMWRDVRDAVITPLDHRTIQTQHLATQIVLEAAGFRELPNDFYTPNTPGFDDFHQATLPSAGNMAAFGAGAYGFHGGAQLFNEFNVRRYAERVDAGELPVWRARSLDDDEMMIRDIVFSLKNAPEIDQRLFRQRYGAAPSDVFADVFAVIDELGLGAVEDDRLQLSAKGRLIVEELCCLFTGVQQPTAETQSPGQAALIRKHNFVPTYGAPPERRAEV